jgi:DnaJ domain
MNNRRNFYRILHVQPEAPFEIIKASYRSLMTKLKVHPDLGGDHESAVLINQAYAVLSDPQKRKQYDEMLHSRKSHGRGYPAHEATTDKPSSTNRYGTNQATREGSRPTSPSQQRCHFCNTVHVVAPQASRYCNHCASPLYPAQPIPNERLRELFGRRAAPRIAKSGAIIIYPSWPHVGYSARLRDLSPSGISILTEYGVRTGQIIKFDSAILKGIARVVSVRVNGTNFLVHASFLTAEFVTKAGVFVTEKV